MRNLLCIGGIFGGQRKKVDYQIWHRFIISTSNFHEQVVGADAIDQVRTFIYEEYRVSQLHAEGWKTEFLIVRGLTDGGAFELLFNSYENVRQANDARLR